MKVIVYCRVSSPGQELEQQIAACQRYCEFKNFIIGDLITDVVSSAKPKRRGYLRLVDELRAYKYDGVVVFRLDRLGRTTRELALLVDELESKGIRVLSVSENFDTSTAMGRAMRELVYVFAELERAQIGEATKQRLAALKAQGKKLGRKPASRFQVRKVRDLRANGLSYEAIRDATRLSYGTVWSIVNRRGVYGDNLQASE